MPLDNRFSTSLRGSIVKSDTYLWYIGPTDGKRYLMLNDKYLAALIKRFSIEEDLASVNEFLNEWAMENARKKSRDSKRYVDVKQIVITIEGKADVNKCRDLFSPVSCLGEEYKGYRDPAGSTPCSSLSTNACDYSVVKTGKSYKICFYLEKGVGNLSKGLQAITSEGKVGQCTASNDAPQKKQKK